MMTAWRSYGQALNFRKGAWIGLETYWRVELILALLAKQISIPH
jgi:hypothetical protein